MGNDGGSFAKRTELVKVKKKPEAVDKANQTRARWAFCALSKRRLEEPIVACALGKLYNKVALIEFLLNRDAYGDGEKICGHIRSLKDVKTLTLTANSAPVPADTDPTEHTQFMCPLTQKEMNGLTPFVYLRTCGCVFAAAGLNAMRSSPSESASEPAKDTCPSCATKYTHSLDCVPLNPSQEEETRLRELMVAERLLEPAKKSKKRKAAAADLVPEPPAKKAAPAPTISTASNALRTTLALEEAKRKATMSDAVKTLYSKGDPQKDTFMTRGTFTRYA
ncbi:Rtf2 domain-containing protein [Mycena chlorophos]|uniref:Rtf2 domain-containing protein n=1 Tax=Mycena chlorophos TaxID=658473 RepID=A0A8H6TTZ0_MYCCL|nr:Rtf2 domain-containing protein [Mycena chlorophos]